MDDKDVLSDRVIWKKSAGLKSLTIFVFFFLFRLILKTYWSKKST